MPRIKRWFHCSQDLNRDPEYRAYVARFGLPGARLWTEILAILDRTDNYWDIHTGFDLGLLASTCESKKAHMLACYDHLRNMKWLRVGLDVSNKMFIYAPKWAEYNKRREHDGSMKDTSREQPGTYPTPTPTPTPKKEKERALHCEAPEKPSASRQTALRVLEFLNQKTGRSYRAYEGLNGKRKPTASLELILARLKSGATEQDMRGVIARKVREWREDPKMAKFLRPATLFNRTNYDQYVGEQEPPHQETM